LQELANTAVLLWHFVDLYEWDKAQQSKALKAIWRHTDQLIFNSRYQEILNMVQVKLILQL
jgi:hypothetical protein